MGSDTIDEKPVHTVTLDTFWIDQTEVTNHMYALCVQTGVCQPPKQSKSSTRTDYYTDAQYEDYPVIYVHWNHANTYCKWADARLPSEAEWEKAARGPDGRTYPWGEGIDQTYANYDNNVGDTTRVGSYPTGGSPYGALDMAGNVMEWVADWYGAYPGNTVGNIDFGTKFRVLRGGPWSTTGLNPRSADRVRFSPYTTTHNLGFRCVATLKSP
jgi:serine/threonine-protein kinase